MNDDLFVKHLYTTYCIAVGNKAFNGDPLPTWEEFRSDPKKQLQADAWEKVAAAATHWCL